MPDNSKIVQLYNTLQQDSTYAASLPDQQTFVNKFQDKEFANKFFDTIKQDSTYANVLPTDFNTFSSKLGLAYDKPNPLSPNQPVYETPTFGQAGTMPINTPTGMEDANGNPVMERVPKAKDVLRPSQVDKVAKGTLDVFKANPELYADPKNRDIFYERLSKRFTPDEMAKIRGNDINVKIPLETPVLGQVGHVTKRVNPISGQPEDVHEKGEWFTNPMKVVGNDAVYEGFKGGWEQVKNTSNVIKTEGQAAGLANAVAGFGKIGLAITMATPQGAAFVEGVSALEDTPAKPVVEFVMSPVSHIAHALKYEPPTSEGGKAAMEIADFLGSAGLLKGLHKAGETTIALNDLRKLSESKLQDGINEAFKDFQKMPEEQQQAVVEKAAENKVDNDPQTQIENNRNLDLKEKDDAISKLDPTNIIDKVKIDQLERDKSEINDYYDNYGKTPSETALSNTHETIDAIQEEIKNNPTLEPILAPKLEEQLAKADEHQQAVVNEVADAAHKDVQVEDLTTKKAAIESSLETANPIIKPILEESLKANDAKLEELKKPPVVEQTAADGAKLEELSKKANVFFKNEDWDSLHGLSKAYVNEKKTDKKTIDDFSNKINVAEWEGGENMPAISDPGMWFVETIEKDGNKIDIYAYASDNFNKESLIFRPHSEIEQRFWEIKSKEDYPSQFSEMMDDIISFNNKYGEDSFNKLENQIKLLPEKSKTKSLQLPNDNPTTPPTGDNAIPESKPLPDNGSENIAQKKEQVVKVYRGSKGNETGTRGTWFTGSKKQAKVFADEYSKGDVTEHSIDVSKVLKTELINTAHYKLLELSKALGLTEGEISSALTDFDRRMMEANGMKAHHIFENKAIQNLLKDKGYNGIEAKEYHGTKTDKSSYLMFGDKAETNPPIQAEQGKEAGNGKVAKDYSKGKTAGDILNEKKHTVNTEDQLDNYIADYSENPKEIAEAYLRKGDYKLSSPDYKGQMIDEYGIKVTPEQFAKWGDANSTSPLMKKRYFSKDAPSLDDALQELSTTAGVEITEQDFVDHLIDQEKQATATKVKGGESGLRTKLKNRFYELTGEDLTPKLITKIFKENEKSINKLAQRTDEQIASDESFIESAESKGANPKGISDAELEEAIKHLDEIIGEEQGTEQANQRKASKEYDAELADIETKLTDAKKERQNKLNSFNKKIDLFEGKGKQDVLFDEAANQSPEQLKQILKPFDEKIAAIEKQKSDFEANKEKYLDKYKGQQDLTAIPEAAKPKEGTNTKGNGKENEAQRGQEGLLNNAPESKPVSGEKGVTPLEDAKAKLAELKAKRKASKENLGIVKDPKQEAEDLYDLHQAYVAVAKEYIKEGVSNVKQFADTLGEAITDAVRIAWDEATGAIDKIKKASDLPYKNENTINQTGISNNIVANEMKQRGLERFEQPLKRDYEGTVLPEAFAELEKDPNRALTLATEIIKNPRTIGDTESAILTIGRMQLHNQHKALLSEIETARDNNASANDIAVLKGQLNSVESFLAENDLAAKKSGTELGRGLAARRMMIAEDMTYAGIVSRYKAIGDGTISDAKREEIKKVADTFEIKNEALALQQELAVEQAKRAEAEQAFKDLKEAFDREKGTKTTFKQDAKKLADKVRKLKGKPFEFKDANGNTVVIESASFYDDAIELAAKAIELSGDVADGIKAAVDHLKKTKTYKEATEKDKEAFENQIEKAVLKDNEIKKPSGSVAVDDDGKLKVSHGLLRDLVGGGIDNVDALTDAVHKVAKEKLPDNKFTKQEVMDAITGYGKTINPKLDVINDKISEYKRDGQLIAGLKDAESGQGVKRTGRKIKPPTMKQRDLKKKIISELKKYPQDAADVAKKWKTTVDGIKTKLKNEIEEIDARRKIIESGGTPDAKIKKTPTKLDAEAQSLKDERDFKKKVLAELEGSKGLTEEERVDNAIAALERADKELDRRIREKDFEPLNNPITDPELLKKLNDAKEEHKKKQQEFKDALSKTDIPARRKAEKEMNAVEKAIAKIKKQIQTGNIEYNKREPKVISEQLQAAIDLKKAYQKSLAQMREDAGVAKAHQIDLWWRNKERTLADLQERKRTGNYSKAPKEPLKMSESMWSLNNEVELERNKIKKLILEKEIANQGKVEKAIHWLNVYLRQSVLSGVSVVTKLAAVATEKQITNFSEELIGGALTKVLPEKVTNMALSEAGFNPQAEVKALTNFLKTITFQNGEALSTLFTGKSSIDRNFGKDIHLPPEAIEFFGQLHGALKSPAKIAQFYRAYEKIGVAMKKADPSLNLMSPMVQETIGTRAYMEANRNILLQDNKITNGYRALLSTLENGADANNIGGKLLGFLARTTMPIVKIPTNFVLESSDYALGSATGLGRLAWHIAHDYKNLNELEANKIYRQLKKGTVGATLLAIGWAYADNIGGYYQQGEKKKEGDPETGGMTIYGHKVPIMFLHNPGLEMLQIGATMRKVYEAHKEKGAESVLYPIAQGAGGLVSEVPMFGTMGEIGNTMKGSVTSKSQFMGQYLSAYVPQLLGEWAKLNDKKEGDVLSNPFGDATKRDQRGFIAPIQAKVPYWRNQLPEKAPTENYYQLHNQLKDKPDELQKSVISKTNLSDKKIDTTVKKPNGEYEQESIPPENLKALNAAREQRVKEVMKYYSPTWTSEQFSKIMSNMIEEATTRYLVNNDLGDISQQDKNKYNNPVDIEHEIQLIRSNAIETEQKKRANRYVSPTK